VPTAATKKQQTEKRDVALALSGCAFAAVVLGPMPLGLAVLVAVAAWSWAAPAESAALERGTPWATIERARKARELLGALRSPGSWSWRAPDDGARGQKTSGLRASAVFAAASAAALACVGALLPSQSSLGVSVVSGVAWYAVIAASCTQRRRASRKPFFSEERPPYPPCPVRPATMIPLRPVPIPSPAVLPVVALTGVGVGVALSYANGSVLWHVSWTLPHILDSSAFSQPPAIGPFPLVLCAVVGLLVALLCAFGSVALAEKRTIGETWEALQDAEDRWAAAFFAASIPQAQIAREDNLDGGIVQATFAIPKGYTIDTWQQAVPKMKSALGSVHITIDPIWQKGTAHPSGMRIRCATAALPIGAHLDPEAPTSVRELALALAVQDAVRAARLPIPTLLRSRVLADGKLIDSRWKLPPGVSITKLIAAKGALQEQLGVSFLVIGEDEDSDETVLVYANARVMELHLSKQQIAWLERLRWSATLRACGLTGDQGAVPRLDAVSYDAQLALHSYDFEATPGLAPEVVEASQSKLVPTVGMPYVAVHKLAGGRWRAVVGESDPLDRAYDFMTYRDQLLVPPTPGTPHLDWGVGAGADGKLMRWIWDNESPHAFVAGATGMGKSTVVSSMLLQMLHNNTPDDLLVYFVEPKNELHTYMDLPHVSGFVDSSGGDLRFRVAELLTTLEEEVNRRNNLFARHPARPKKLSEARYIAVKDSVPQLMLPYVLVVLEECAMYLRHPDVKDEKEAYETTLQAVNRVAMIGRSAGVYLVVVTQYPVKENVPTTLKQQCRRIGLGVSAQVASLVIIDEPGLEKIHTKGRGKMSYGKGYEEFRAFRLRSPDQDSPNEPDDRAAVLAEIASGGSPVSTNGAAARSPHQQRERTRIGDPE
jgi:hypothetical protein